MNQRSAKSVNKVYFFIPKAKDLYDALLPVFILSRILGLAPFKFQHLQSRRFVPFCGPITVLRIITIIGVMGYVAVLIHDPNSVLDIRSFAVHCELCCGAIITSIVLILAVINQNLLIQVVENIIKIDGKMTKLGINITYNNAQKFAYFQICGITCVFLSKVVLQAFIAKEYYIFVYNVFNVVDYVNTIMLFQYVDILLLLRQRYIWINREIRTVGIQKKNNMHQFNYSPEILNKLSIPEMLNKGSTPENVIKSLGKLHMQLYDTAKLANRTYGLQLLASICARFIMITTQLITVYKTIQDPMRGDAITYSVTAIYLFLHASKVFMVASISENTAAKARDTGIYLHKLWELNNVAKDKITFFSLQVLHQNLRFSAAGFFVLDYTFIHSIVAAVTTYLIIVIQYDATQSQS